LSSKTSLAEICLVKSLKKKQFLFMENEKGFSIYILIKGNIQLYKTAPDGREIVIKIVKPGELFAEAILFERNRYPVSAIALADSQVLMIPKPQFDCLLENVSFRNEFMGNLMGKMRYLTDQIKFLTHHDVEERLLLFIEEQYGYQEEIHIRLSKKDVANAIGTTPETLSRVLLRMKQEKKLFWEGHIIKRK
jgi:CRP/FNR family transcriptional regulator